MGFRLRGALQGDQGSSRLETLLCIGGSGGLISRLHLCQHYDNSGLLTTSLLVQPVSAGADSAPEHRFIVRQQSETNSQTQTVGNSQTGRTTRQSQLPAARENNIQQPRILYWNHRISHHPQGIEDFLGPKYRGLWEDKPSWV